MDIKAHRLTGIWEKSKGLIGDLKINPIYFETRWGIHTFGIKSEIDVLILDNNNKTAVIKESLKPNRVFMWNPRFKKVLELPAGQIRKLGIKTGGIITVKPIR
jgi:uncharacterized membrane protein (UPF0127 family)